MTTAARRDDLRRGALLMVLAALCFALMGAGVKVASRTLPNTMVVFFRNAVALAIMLPWLMREGPRGLRTRHLGEHLVRGLAGLASMACFFYAIARLPLASAVLLNYCLPLFLPVIERVWLGEHFPHAIWPPIGVGFLGVLVILRPGSGLFTPVSLVGLSAAVFAALAQVGIRRLTATEPVTRIVFYFALIATAASALPVIGSWRNPEPEAWLAILALGLFATVAQFLMTSAYQFAPAALIGPFIYSGVVFAGILDWLVWEKLPDAMFVGGAALVVLAAVLMLRLRQPAAPPQRPEASGTG
jgi:drug/metabolite transporter (DMT)-like permease